MPMELHTKEGLNRALKHLENADPYKAHDELLALFYSDINNMELVFTGNYCNLWCEYLKTTLKIEDSFLKGEQLLIDWKNFISYIRRQSDIFEPALFALDKNFIVSYSTPNSSVIFVISLPTTPVAPKIAICGFLISFSLFLLTTYYIIFSKPYMNSGCFTTCFTAINTPGM